MTGRPLFLNEAAVAIVAIDSLFSREGVPDNRVPQSTAAAIAADLVGPSVDHNGLWNNIRAGGGFGQHMKIRVYGFFRDTRS